ncbi:MAG TPA: BatD family protein [Saprospiraceae bacterium]|nr:BatD family protein [Saprospiraceae bacterium]
MKRSKGKLLKGSTYIVIWFLLFTWVSIGLSAQERYIRIDISSDTILLGNVCEIKFSAVNIGGKFEAPDMKELAVVGGPNVASSMQFVNGQMTQSISYTYIIKPENTGSFFVGSAYFVNQENTFETPPFELIVIPNPGQKIHDARNSKTIYRSDTSEQVDAQKSTSPKRKKIKL